MYNSLTKIVFKVIILLQNKGIFDHATCYQIQNQKFRNQSTVCLKNLYKMVKRMYTVKKALKKPK